MGPECRHHLPRMDEGRLSLVIVPGLFNRAVVGRSREPCMTADCGDDAPTPGWFRPKPAPGVIPHSDRGSRSARHASPATPAQDSMVCSMSREGNCRYNASTESRFERFKKAWIFGERFATRDAMQATAFADIEVFYNRKRLYSTRGDTSPVEFPNGRINLGKAEQEGA
jgi:putative transposase